MDAGVHFGHVGRQGKGANGHGLDAFATLVLDAPMVAPHAKQKDGKNHVRVDFRRAMAVRMERCPVVDRVLQQASGSMDGKGGRSRLAVGPQVARSDPTSIGRDVAPCRDGRGAIVGAPFVAVGLGLAEG